MLGMERHGAEQMLRSIITELQSHGMPLVAEAIRRRGQQVIDGDDNESVFPAAADMVSVHDTPTLTEFP